jgi:peptidoglycan hydrolase CwlO-like protein
LESAVSIEDRRALEKSLDRAEWEKRDVATEIARIQEQMDKVSARLKTLKKRLEKSLSSILRGDIEIEFPDEVNAIFQEDSTDES